MHVSIHRSSVLARAIMAGAWGIVCGLILAAPILMSHSCHSAASVLYLSFSWVCHQIPERSFALLGHPLAACHRCFGIYLGLFLGSLTENRFVYESLRARRFWILAASIPLLLDVLLNSAGLWTNTCFSRFFTGLLFGNLASPLLVRGVTEFLNEAPWRKFVTAHLKGGFS
jgi:uncharacterized membrane protein